MTSRAVSAISIDFMSGANSIPSAKEVLGSEADMRKDGSVYKMFALSESRVLGIL